MIPKQFPQMWAFDLKARFNMILAGDSKPASEDSKELLPTS